MDEALAFCYGSFLTIGPHLTNDGNYLARTQSFIALYDDFLPWPKLSPNFDHGFDRDAQANVLWEDFAFFADDKDLRPPAAEHECILGYENDGSCLSNGKRGVSQHPGFDQVGSIR